MILDYENGIRGRITRAICQCGEAKDKQCMVTMKQEKVHRTCILTLTINTNGLYYNHFLIMDLAMMKIHKYLNMTLL